MNPGFFAQTASLAETQIERQTWTQVRSKTWQRVQDQVEDRVRILVDVQVYAQGYRQFNAAMSQVRAQAGDLIVEARRS